jgi:hypothetical protein
MKLPVFMDVRDVFALFRNIQAGGSDYFHYCICDVAGPLT